MARGDGRRRKVARAARRPARGAQRPARRKAGGSRRQSGSGGGTSLVKAARLVATASLAAGTHHIN